MKRARTEESKESKESKESIDAPASPAIELTDLPTGVLAAMFVHPSQLRDLLEFSTTCRKMHEAMGGFVNVVRFILRALPRLAADRDACMARLQACFFDAIANGARRSVDHARRGSFFWRCRENFAACVFDLHAGAMRFEFFNLVDGLDNGVDLQWKAVHGVYDETNSLMKRCRRGFDLLTRATDEIDWSAVLGCEDPAGLAELPPLWLRFLKSAWISERRRPPGGTEYLEHRFPTSAVCGGAVLRRLVERSPRAHPRLKAALAEGAWDDGDVDVFYRTAGGENIMVDVYSNKNTLTRELRLYMEEARDAGSTSTVARPIDGDHATICTTSLDRGETVRLDFVPLGGRICSPADACDLFDLDGCRAGVAQGMARRVGNVDPCENGRVTSKPTLSASPLVAYALLTGELRTVHSLRLDDQPWKTESRRLKYERRGFRFPDRRSSLCSELGVLLEEKETGDDEPTKHRCALCVDCASPYRGDRDMDARAAASKEQAWKRVLAVATGAGATLVEDE